MKCQHCGADIKDGVLFCDVCGQPVSEPSSEETTIKKFWNAENNKKKEDIISDLAGLKGKSDEVQDVIIKGKKLKAKKLFFRIMLLFFVALVAVVAFTGYKVYETRGESYTNLLIASSLTLIVHLLFLTFSTIVANSGALKIFYLLIPVFGYFYFLYSFVCGLIRMIAPLKKDEKACVKEMNTKRTEFRILKKEEKNLKDGLDLIDKGILKSEALKDLRNPIVVEKKGTRGWLVTSVIAIIVLAVAFFAFQYVAQVIVDSGIGEEIYEATHTHNYSDWVVEREPTEERAGLQVRTCSGCGDRIEETLSKLDHTHNYSSWVVEKKATEESTGLRVQTCSKCGDRIEETIAKLDHVHVTVKAPAVAATCSTIGKTEGSYCSKCNEVFTAQQDVPMDHSFVNGTCKYCNSTDVPSTGLAMQLNSDKKSYSVTGIGSCSDAEVVMPMTYEGLPVTHISKNAFKGNVNIEKVVISNSIVSIGTTAFAGCKRIQEISLGTGLISIGNSAFYGCTSLQELVIPANVKTISNDREYIDSNYRGVFEGCTALIKVTIGDEKYAEELTTIGSEAFQNCSALKEIYIGNAVGTIGDRAFNATGVETLTIGSNVKSIGEAAFYWCDKLTQVVIPDSVTTIGKTAFSYCKRMSSITFGSGLKTIGASAFYNCISLTEVTIPSNVKTISNDREYLDSNYRGVFEGCTALTKVTIGDEQYGGELTTIGSEAFQNCSALKEIYIGNAVGTIGDRAFNATGVETLTIGSNVKSIGEAAFYWCDKLTQVVIPDSVTTIGKTAFSYCKRMTSITFGSGLKTIGASAFYNCISLTEVTIPSNVKTISNDREYLDSNYRGVFEGCSALTKVTIGDANTDVELTSIGADAFQSCGALKEVYIGNAVVSIGECAFNDTGIVSITIGTNVKTIGTSAFYSCNDLKTVLIPDSVTNINKTAFTYCTSLTSITFGKGLNSIGASAFYGCTSLKELVIPANVKTISNDREYIDSNYRGVFEGCTSLVKVTIGDANTDVELTSIGTDAFQSCGALKEVYIGNAVGSIGECAFNDTGIVSITIGTNVKTIGVSAFYSCNDLKTVLIPDSVTSISKKAFTYCTSLTSITFGKGLNSIGASAFYGCTSLKELVIPANVKTISNDREYIDSNYRGVFEGCTALTKVTIGDDQTDIDKTTIGCEAFQGCTSLESVTLGRNVGSLGESSFKDCSKLSVLYYLGSETEWDSVNQGSNWYSNTGITKVTYVQ